MCCVSMVCRPILNLTQKDVCLHYTCRTSQPDVYTIRSVSHDVAEKLIITKTVTSGNKRRRKILTDVFQDHAIQKILCDVSQNLQDLQQEEIQGPIIFMD